MSHANSEMPFLKACYYSPEALRWNNPPLLHFMEVDLHRTTWGVVHTAHYNEIMRRNIGSHSCNMLSRVTKWRDNQRRAWQIDINHDPLNLIYRTSKADGLEGEREFKTDTLKWDSEKMIPSRTQNEIQDSEKGTRIIQHTVMYLYHLQGM